jgi:CRISPR-associated protein Cmr4
MFRAARMLFLYTETPLHAGSGTSVVGVDLPIQRERHTQYPMIQSSGIKGALRDVTEQVKGITPVSIKRLSELRKKADKDLTPGEREQKNQLEQVIVPVEIVFGPETERASEHGGALSFTDARLLLFPVRSLTGVFAWITCPTVIERFKRDLRRLERFSELEGIMLSNSDPAKAFAPQDCDVRTADNQIVLEDFAFQVDPTKASEVTTLADWLATHALPQNQPAYTFWRDRLPKALVVVHDDVFRDFVQFSTEVIARIRIGETGTVQTGALWSEEHLPSDTLLYSLALATDPKVKSDHIADAAQVLRFLKQEVLDKASVVQFGGDETVGRGIVQVTVLDREDASSRGGK